MTEEPSEQFFPKAYQALFSLLCIVYVGILVHYAVAMWETRQRYSIIFVTLTLMIASFSCIKKERFLFLRGIYKNILLGLLFCLALACGIYFWREYPSLVYERAGFINNTDACVAAIYLVMVISFTWATSGYIIPTVTIVFILYGMFGHLLPGFLHHPPISFVRFMELSCAEINGVFGTLSQIGGTWIAIFCFFAGFVHGFGGLDYIMRCVYHLVGRRKTGLPQVAVLASMGFGCMSGSAGANAASTGAFTIPTMKRYGLPAAQAASIETVASCGGQVMPPILGAAAFVMCDYLDMYYYQILLASLFPSIIFFGSTMLSVHFVATRYIDPHGEVDIPEEIKAKMTLDYILKGLPLAVSFLVLLYVFMVYRMNILLGGFCIIGAFLITQFIYDLILIKGSWAAIKHFFNGVYQGAIKGTQMMVPIGAMLATLGIVIRVLTTTGLAEKLSYSMVTVFGQHLWMLLPVIMVVCIFFGMAVTTVAAYILVVTLAAPALLKVGVDPLAAHFCVFYWAMLSSFTPPVAAVCVITAGIAEANFLKTCWETIKLGAPKFILPFIFVSYPEILSFSWDGFVVFFISSVGFIALSAAIQSNWGWQRRGILLVLAILTLFSPNRPLVWILVVVTAVLFIAFWRQIKGTSSPRAKLATID